MMSQEVSKQRIPYKEAWPMALTTVDKSQRTKAKQGQVVIRGSLGSGNAKQRRPSLVGRH